MIHYRGCCANQIQPTRQFLSYHHYHLVQSWSGDKRKWLIQEVHESQQKLLLPNEGVVCHHLARRDWHICPTAAPGLKKWRMKVHEPLINLLCSFWEWVAAAIILSQELVHREFCHCCMWVQKHVGATSPFSPGKAKSLVRPAERRSFYWMEQHGTVHYANDDVLLAGDKSCQPP